MNIIYTPRFERDYKKLPEFIQGIAEERETIFKQDPFDPRLKTHKLAGWLDGYWSFSVNYSYRIVFRFAKNNTVYFHLIGDHRLYD